MRDRNIVVPPQHLFPPDEWRIVEARWTPGFAARAETALALSNGYLGVRGTPRRGAPGVGARRVRQRLPRDVADHPRRGRLRAWRASARRSSTCRTPRSSSCTSTTSRCSSRRRACPSTAASSTCATGVLTRELVWATPSGKHARVRSTRLVSFEHRHVMAMSYEVTMDRPAPVVLRSRVLNRANAGRDGSELAGAVQRSAHRPATRSPDPRAAAGGRGRRAAGARLPDGREWHDARAWPWTMRSTCRERTTSRCTPTPTRRSSSSPSTPSRRSASGSIKYAAYQTSRSVDAAELVERCRRTLDRVVGAGFESLVTAQRSCLDRFWDRADVTLEDTDRHPVRMQQAVRWNLFHLAQATWRAEGAGIPAKGLTGDAYDGHYFWDTETWVLPFLAYTQPRIARNLLRFRHSMLGQGTASGRRAGPAGRTVSVAHDRRRRGVGVSPGRHRPVPPQRRHRLRHPPLRRRTRRHRLPHRDRRRDPRRDGADVDGPRLLRRRRLLPHPRRHRSRRVHGDGRRQRLHQPDGPPQPPLRGGRRAATPSRAPGGVRRASGRADPGPVRAGRVGAGRRAHVRPARRRPRDHTPGRHVPHARALGPRRASPAARFPCCSTTTRSPCTAARC